MDDRSAHGDESRYYPFRVKARFLRRPRQGAWVDASVDLAAVAKQLPATLHLRDDLRVEHGTARLRADILLAADGHTQNWNISGKIADLAARQGQKLLTLPEPASLTAKLERTETAMKLARLDVQSSFLTATGQGDLDERHRRRGHSSTSRPFASGSAIGSISGRSSWPVKGSSMRATSGMDRPIRQASMRSFQDLRLGGLPLVGKLERNHVTFSGKLGGEATAAGWPVSWRELSLQASTGELSSRGGSTQRHEDRESGRERPRPSAAWSR